LTSLSDLLKLFSVTLNVPLVNNILTTVLLVESTELNHQPVHVPSVIMKPTDSVILVTIHVLIVTNKLTTVSLVPLTESISQIVSVQLVISILVLLIVTHVQSPVLLVPALLTVLLVPTITTYMKTNAQPFAQPDISLTVLPTLATNVTLPVKLVPEPPLPNVLLVKLQTISTKDNVTQLAQLVSMLKTTADAAKFVTTLVPPVMPLITEPVILVTKVTS